MTDEFGRILLYKDLIRNSYVLRILTKTDMLIGSLPYDPYDANASEGIVITKVMAKNLLMFLTEGLDKEEGDECEDNDI